MEKWERRKGGGEQKKAGSDARVWRRGGEGEEAASLALSGVIGSWTANLSSLINSSRGDCSPAGACWEKKQRKGWKEQERWREEEEEIGREGRWGGTEGVTKDWRR